ncbi:class I SAM-dependent methyltransferase [Erwinia sp. V71]|uniref:class I SAM-dependent methyltransferase n=1 Tax=Erwinia sp. V71 TaxID=3369424 RepID=UPI003F641A4E
MTFPVTLLNELASSAVVADAVHLALQAGVFEHLQQPRQPQQVATTLDWQAEKTAHLLELLWSVGLLTREHGLYQTTTETRTFFCRDGGHFIGDAWCFRLENFRRFGQQLATILPQPSDVFSEQHEYDAAWADAARRQIAQEQQALTATRACEIAATLVQFDRPATLLDMGGGPGLVSIALAQRYPQLRGMLNDLPLTAQVAQQNFVAAGIADRFSAVSAIPDEQRFDVIWCSSFLYFVADPAQMLARFFRLLNPGGVLISVHGEVPAQPQRAAQMLPAHLPLMMRGKHVTHEGEMRARLDTAGFDRVEHMPGTCVFPMSPLSVHLAFRSGGS